MKEIKIKLQENTKNSVAQKSRDKRIDNIKIEVIKYTIKKISGLMKNIKKKSVELQHEAWKK